MKFKKIHPSVLSIVLLLVIWQVSAYTLNKPALFPSILDVVFTLSQMMGQLSFYQDITSTLIRGILGFILATILAFGCASLSIHRKFWKSFFHPIIIAVRSVPVISVVLIALLWFSPPSLPVFIALLTMFPILYQNILSGLEQTDTKLIEMAKVYKKNSFQRFFLIYLPGARKLILDGMATAMGFGWRAIIIGEALANPIHAIGAGMKKAQAYIQMNELVAWTLIAILISFGFDHLLRYFNKNSINSKIKLQNIISTSEAEIIEYVNIDISKLNKKFNDINLIRNLSIQLENSKIYWLNAPSGSGKTTLLKIIAGITKKDSGQIEIKSDLKISYAFQDIRLIPWLTIRENIAFSISSYPYISRDDDSELQRLMEKSGISALANHFPATLSGGEARRVELLRALISPAQILLLDEPLTGLDEQAKKSSVKLIESYINQYKPVTLWATHEKTEISVPGKSVSLITNNFTE